jgi:valyl-tRNA synthetase
MIDQYGTDATRLSLLLGSTPGNDMKLSAEKVAGFRNFTNKLWNIARFMLMQIGEQKMGAENSQSGVEPKTMADEWVLAKFNDLIGNVTKAIEEYQFSAAGEMLREFTWDTLADWYLEVAKIEGGKEHILSHLLENLLKLWHPYMPFVTEAIWQEWGMGGSSLMIQRWPSSRATLPFHGSEFDRIMNVISGIRAKRAEQKIEPAKKIDVVIKAQRENLELVKKYQAVIQGLRTGIENLVVGEDVQARPGSVMFAISGVEVHLDLSGAVDTEKEKVRISKELGDVERYVAGLTQKLANEQFISNAPAAVVALERKKLAEAEEKLRVLREQAKNF